VLCFHDALKWAPHSAWGQCKAHAGHERDPRRRYPAIGRATCIGDRMRVRDSWGSDLRGTEPLTSSMPRKWTATVKAGTNSIVWGERSRPGSLTPACPLRETHDDLEGHTDAGGFITGRRASACTFASAKPYGAANLPFARSILLDRSLRA